MKTEIETFLVGVVAKILKINPDEIKVNADLSTYGFDSMLALKMLSIIEDNYKVSLEPEIIFDYPNIASLADYLQGVGCA